VDDIPGLLNDSPQAQKSIEQQIRDVPFLANKSAGLTIVYGGTLDDAGIGQAQDIAGKVYGILQKLGNEHFVFDRSSFYKPLYTFGDDPSNVEVDVYFFQE
jgi:hypothetical protein